MRILTITTVALFLSLVDIRISHAQEITWERPISHNTRNAISRIIDQETVGDLERIAHSIPESHRDTVRRELLHTVISGSFDSNNWSNTEFLIDTIKVAQASSFLAPAPRRLPSLTTASIDEAHTLRNLIAYPSQQHGSLLLWARQFDLNTVIPTMRSAQYAVSIAQDMGADGDLTVLERLIGTEYAGLSEEPTHAPRNLVKVSNLRLGDDRAGSTVRMSLGEFFVAVTIGKLATLLPSFQPPEQLLLRLAILNGVEGAAWQGASWAPLAFRSRLSRFLVDLESPESPFSETDIIRLQHRLVSATFFARAFETAAEKYLAHAEKPRATNFDKLYGYHGAAMSYLALGDEETGYGYLREAALNVEWNDNLPYAFSLVSIDRATNQNFLAAEDKDPVPSIEQGMLGAFGTILHLYSTQRGRQTYEDMNEDFLRVMHTIGRPDIAIRHGIKQVKILDENWLEDDRNRLQSFFVREICASLTDLFYGISFEWRDGAWVLRSGQQDEFLPTFVQLLEPGRYDDLYSKSHPEEDRAVTLENAVHSRALSRCENDDDQSACMVAKAMTPSEFVSIDDWVEHHQNGKAGPSRAFLKAIWAYWFGLGLEGKGPWENESFVYSPEDIFPSLSLSSAKRLLKDGDKEVESKEKRILELMIETREFLDQRFRRAKR